MYQDKILNKRDIFYYKGYLYVCDVLKLAE
jgi:hypothetical protein